MKTKLVLLILTILLVSAVAAPVIMNPGFEGGWHSETTYWTPKGGPYHDQFQEIAPPSEWTAWWREGFLCSGTSNWRTGRPEVRVISGPDPERIHSGSQATQWLTLWRCHEGGLYQTVTVEAGKYYTLKAFGHSWFSNCDSRPHDAPYDYDCTTPINWAHSRLSVGIDHTGGTDPANVFWGPAQEVYGVYGEPLVVEHVWSQGGKVTIWLRGEVSHPLKHCDTYWDDVILYDVSYRLFLPFVWRN